MKPEIWLTLLGLGFPIAFIAGMWLVLQYPRVKVIIADLLRLGGFLGNWTRRTCLKAELEGSVNSFSRLFNSEFDTPLLPECRVEWVNDQNYKHLLEPGQAIVRLNFLKGEHDLSFYNAASAYVQTAFLNQVKPFLRKATSTAIDLLMVKILLRNARRTAITVFNERFGQQESAVKETFAKLEESDERGLFRQLFVQELHFFGQGLGLKSPLLQFEKETEGFLQWFYDLATREEKEQTTLHFFSENIRIGVILVADTERYEKLGLKPYIRRANQYAASKCHTIYVLSRGSRRADISAEIVNRLLLTGCFRKLTRRSRMLKFDIREPVIITCYSLKPDLAEIETKAWTSLQADFDQNQFVSGFIELVTSTSVRVDVYGLKIDIPLERLSSLSLNDARSLFKPDQTLQLKILRLARTQGEIELSNDGTETDPQRLCKELGQLGTQIRDGTVAKILHGKDNQFEFALIVQFSHRDQRLDCFIPRQGATFTKYTPLSTRYQPGQGIQFILENFDVEHSQYVGRVAGLSDPWEQIGRYSVGQTTYCTVRKVTEYYVTCELQEGLEGEIYFDELSWGSREDNEKLVRSQTVGRAIEACILNIDKDRRVISLSVRRLTKSACEKFFVAFADKVVRSTVTAVQPGRMYAEFPGGSGTGFLPRQETFLFGDLRRSVQIGKVCDVKLLEYDYGSDTILVSLKRVTCDEFEKAAATIKPEEQVLAEVLDVSLDRISVMIHPNKIHGYIHKAEISLLLFCDIGVLRRLFKPGDYFACTVKRIDAANQAIEVTRKGFLRIAKENLEYGHPYRVFLLKDRNGWVGYSDQLEGVLIDKRPRINEGWHDVMIASKDRAAVELTLTNHD